MTLRGQEWGYQLTTRRVERMGSAASNFAEQLPATDSDLARHQVPGASLDGSGNSNTGDCSAWVVTEVGVAVRGGLAYRRPH